MPGRSAERHLPGDGAEPAGTRRVHPTGGQGSPSGISGHDRLRETAGERQDVAVNRQHAGRRGGVRVSPPAAASPPALGHDPAVTEDGPHPLAEVGAIAARCEHRRPRRPCHKRAIHSSPDRSRADNHGQNRNVLELGRSRSSQVTAAPDLALQAGVIEDDPNPRTGQHSERFCAHQKWFAGKLLATGVQKGFQEPVCAGGRDRFRTCGLCRVKRVRPPHTALQHHAPHHIIPARRP
jgi:hypothetical protein